MRKRYCESEASRLRRERSITQPPVNVERIARAMFLDVQRKDPWRWKGRAMLRRELGQIWVKATESERAQRFCIGHEIGHFVLHPDLDVFSDHVDPDSPEYATDPMKALDDEADYFSSVLLVPPDWLRKDVVRGVSPEKLAQDYQVSPEVMFIAITQHNLLNKVAPVRR